MLNPSPQHIHYAKTKSYAVLRREDPDFIPPNPVHSKLQNGASGLEKRSREDDETTDGTRQVKREKPSGEEDGEEMELEDEDDSGAQTSAQCASMTDLLNIKLMTNMSAWISRSSRAGATNCTTVMYGAYFTPSPNSDN